MRPSMQFVTLLLCYICLALLISPEMRAKRIDTLATLLTLKEIAGNYGLSDLSLSTEARYTRHPAASDRVVVVMDHLGAVDHFPSTLFWAPTPTR